jgi:hypothetical protein
VSESPKIVLTPLGDPDAEACVDGVCEIPPSGRSTN